jgi:heterodisulfide reductase subunit B
MNHVWRCRKRWVLNLMKSRVGPVAAASAAHQTDRKLAVSLASANLLLAKQMGMDMVVNCAACYNRSKVANYEIINSEE